jgi:HKD family nuclease
MSEARLIASYRGHPILTRLRQCIAGADRVLVACGYVSVPGIELVFPKLEQLLRRGGRFSLYATFDGTPITPPDPFLHLVNLARSHGDRVELYLYPSPRSLFHAKAFLFEDAKGRWSGLIGSANLTKPALMGEHFEVVADCQQLATGEVAKLMAQLNRLRESAQLFAVTPESIQPILARFGMSNVSYHAPSLRLERDSVQSRLSSLNPGYVAPLAPLSISAQEYIDGICGTGTGVGTLLDTSKLSISLDYGRYVDAGVVAKKRTEEIDSDLIEKTNTGYSLRLIPKDLRDRISSASRSVSQLIGARSLHAGIAAWMPRAFQTELQEEIEKSKEVRDSREALHAKEGAVRRHLTCFQETLECKMQCVADHLTVVKDRAAWKLEKLGTLGLSQRAKPADIKHSIASSLVEKYRPRVCEEFVFSQLNRAAFSPCLFPFPLQQSVSNDSEYGHRYFLTSLVWAVTDPILRHGDTDDVQSRNKARQYLRWRYRQNAGRHGSLDATGWDAMATEWLRHDRDLSSCVEEFRRCFGDGDEWAWT